METEAYLNKTAGLFFKFPASEIVQKEKSCLYIRFMNGKWDEALYPRSGNNESVGVAPAFVSIIIALVWIVFYTDNKWNHFTHWSNGIKMIKSVCIGIMNQTNEFRLNDFFLPAPLCHSCSRVCSCRQVVSGLNATKEKICLMRTLQALIFSARQ